MWLSGLLTFILTHPASSCVEAAPRPSRRGLQSEKVQRGLEVQKDLFPDLTAWLRGRKMKARVSQDLTMM